MYTSHIIFSGSQMLQWISQTDSHVIILHHLYQTHYIFNVFIHMETYGVLIEIICYCRANMLHPGAIGVRYPRLGGFLPQGGIRVAPSKGSQTPLV